VRNQLEFQKQRCSAMVLAKAADTGRPAAPPVATSKTTKPIAPPVEPAAAVKPPPKGSFGVQIVAAPTRAKADEALASLKRAGFEAFLVTEGGLFKVRAGPYATRAAAQAALPRVRSRLGGTPFIVANK
jgi:cell division septation protein DedD